MVKCSTCGAPALEFSAKPWPKCTGLRGSCRVAGSLCPDEPHCQQCGTVFVPERTAATAHVPIGPYAKGPRPILAPGDEPGLPDAPRRDAAYHAGVADERARVLERLQELRLRAWDERAYFLVTGLIDELYHACVADEGKIMGALNAAAGDLGDES